MIHTERIEAIRQIVKGRRKAKVDGMMVDSYTAQAILQVHDALTDKPRALFAAMPIGCMASIAWKLINKFGTKHEGSH